MSESFIHTRYCCWSKLFWDHLNEIGFVEHTNSGSGKDMVKRFWKGGNLKIEDSYNGITLFRKEKINVLKGDVEQWVVKYKGMSVNKDLLENFSNKGFYNQ